MKHRNFRRLIGLILTLVMVVGMIPSTVIPIHAINIRGMYSASKISANDGIVLYGDTTLNMDTDLTVAYIEGDYNLTIQGSGTLTVNGGGNGISVKSLNCSSDLFIQTGWHAIEAAETVYIQNTDSFIVGGIYATGNIDIQCNNATIGGNGNAIVSTLGSITLSGSTFDIGANGVAVQADVGNVYMTGAFTVNSNDDRTIDAREGAVTIDGSLKSTSGAKFDPDVHIAERDKFSIGAAGGFNFYGTTLEVTGLGGITAGISSDISITADSVSIITERYRALYSEYIYVDSDELWLENEGREENENVILDYATVYAMEDATLYSENGGIVGESGIHIEGTLTLNGNFVVGGDPDYEDPLIKVNRLDAAGNLTVRNDIAICIDADEGVSFNGENLDIKGFGGIDTDGDVSITADNVSIYTQKLSCIEGKAVSIDCDVLRLENQPSVADPERGQYGICGYEAVNVNCPDATIVACDNAIYGNGCDVTLNGSFTMIGKGSFGNGVFVREGTLYLIGEQFTIASNIRQGISASQIEANCASLSVQAHGDVSNTDYSIGIMANHFTFNGTTLTVNACEGIRADYTDINADSVVVTSDVGNVIEGSEIYITANYLWAENKSTKRDSYLESRGINQHGIYAYSKMDLNVKNGTVIGYEDAIVCHDENNQFDTHYIYIDGSITAVSMTGAGIRVPQGIAGLEGGPIVSVGETHGIYADRIYFEGGSLTVSGATGIYAALFVELSGDDIKITAEGERKSGIWTEYGYVDLEGKVTINTNGWYGINAGDDLSFRKGYYEISGPKGNAQAVMVGGELYMDGTLEIVEPIYGHVNGNDIYGTGDSPAMELLMYSAITEVSLLIDGPREGRLPTRNASGIYFLDPRCTVEEIIWYEDGEEMVSQDAVFRAGHSYTVRIIISADDPYRFLGDVMSKVNDKEVSTGLTDKKIMRLTADLGECPNAVDIVELEIAAPVEGNKPSTGVSDPSSEYGVYSRNVRWMVSTDGINFYSMASGEKFVGGKYYRVFMDVNLAGKDYKFPITTADGTVQPDVISYVNGNRAVTEKAYDQDPETVITVYYDFGKCNDFIIEEINIVDVVAPVAGQHPTYTAKMFGTGYHIDTTKNSYEDIYWKNPPEKWYYVKNGVQWWDTTTGSYEYVYENDTFIPGHTYSCTIYVRVDDGFTFARSNGETLLTGTINGNTAQIVTGWTDSWNTRVTYTFTCEMPTVSTIQVYDIDVPKAGNLPDYTATLANPDLYQLDTDYGLNGSGIYWYDCEGRQLEAGERFGDAGPYRMAIKFVPVISDGVSISQFADEVEVVINGKSVNTYGNWDDVVVGNGAVWAFYTFTGYSSAPEQGSCTISGNVTSYGDGILTLELIPKNQTTPIAMGTFDSNGSYSFWGLAVGVYTLRVSKPNHVTREYIVVVTNDVVQDVEINLIGDANIDGKVNMKDWSRLYNHISEVDLLSDYGLSCADVNQDGKINMKDWARLYAHISETDPLW